MNKPWLDAEKPELQVGHRVVLLNKDYEVDTLIKLSDLPVGTQALELCPCGGYDEGDSASVDVCFIGYIPFKPEEELCAKERHDRDLKHYEMKLAAYQLELSRYEMYLQMEQDKTELQQYEILKKKFESQ